jgi:hypothetical protein
MAIVTTAKVKEILQISGSDYDSLIGTLIPIAESQYVMVRGIDFFVMEGNLTTSSGIVELVNTNDMCHIKKNGRIESREDSGTKIRGTVTYLDFDDYEVTLDDVSTVTEDEVELIIYPGNVDYVISKIVGWMLAKDNATGIQAETWGTYNYTKFDSATGMPMDIAKMITQYHKVR